MNGCRIGKIKLKSGGEIHRLPALQRDEPQRLLVERAAKLAGYYKPGELRGYVVFAWDKDGFNSLGYYIDKEGPVGVTMAPSFVADALRRRLIEEHDWES